LQIQELIVAGPICRQDVFDYIEMFYNSKRKQVRNGMLSPVEFEKQQKIQPEGVYETRGYSIFTWRPRIPAAFIHCQPDSRLSLMQSTWPAVGLRSSWQLLIRLT
jgi:hypothetical protein